MIAFLYSWIASLLMLHLVAQSSPFCPCDGPNKRNSQWGTWSTIPVCSGSCGNTVLTGNSTCFIVTSNERRNVATFSCTRRQTNGCDVCEGQWGPWGSIDQCNAVCGFGIKLESRTCYLVREKPENVRTAQCAGEFGVYDQYRNSSCARLNNCHKQIERTTTVSRTRRPEESTFPTTTTTETTTTIATTSVVTNFSEVEKDPMPTRTAFVEAMETKTSSSRTPPIVIPPAPPIFVTHAPPSGGFDTVILAAVLGSVAMICVTIVAVAVAVVMLKKKRPFINTASYSTADGGNVVTTITQSRTQHGNYERRGSEFPQNNLTYVDLDRPVIVKNDIYETTLLAGNGGDGVKVKELTNQEAVYFSIEEKRHNDNTV